MPLHASSTNYVLIIRRSNLYYIAPGIVTLCRWPSGAQVSNGRPPTECDVRRCCIIQFDLLMISTTVLETSRGIKLTYYKRRICALSWSMAKIIVSGLFVRYQMPYLTLRPKSRYAKIIINGK
jgi:hypothetical protein